MREEIISIAMSKVVPRGTAVAETKETETHLHHTCGAMRIQRSPKLCQTENAQTTKA